MCSSDLLDAFCDAMLQIAREAVENPEVVLNAPHTMPVSRVDETRAAKQPDLGCHKSG